MPLRGSPLAQTLEPCRLLERGLADGADRPALISATDTLTWRELERASSQVAAGYLKLGLMPGDRVASLMPNRTALLVHYVACIKGGLVATPLNYRYTPPEIDHALEVSGASIVLAHAERDEDLDASHMAAKLPLGRIRYGGQNGDAAGGIARRWEEVAAETPR